MFKNHIFRAAVAHTAPVYLDPLASAEKAVSTIAEAAGNGAKLIAFSEGYLPGFPVWAAIHSPVKSHGLFKKYVEASVFADGPEVAIIRKAAARYGVIVSLGISERNPSSVGGLWNSNLLIDETGSVLNHHRKLVPTFYEKLTWDQGDGAGLKVLETSQGRIGNLICGENTNPLSRYSLMAQAEQVHISSYPPIWPTRPPEESANFDNRAANLIRAAGHAFEAKCFGVVVAGCFDARATELAADGDPALMQMLDACPRAQSFFVDPTGAQIGDSLTEEGIGYADIDLDKCIEPKRFHDVTAGYNRFDIYDLRVNRHRTVPITFNDELTPCDGSAGTADEDE
ncbi:carbon-nitrogen hydrolase family protein [Roseobacter sp.]|uniref:carbon-nitrogen hydrolase family protein n=1 Tax=Roseobacter sp. TaxID=1907202 RepID=UPI0032988900